jgi:3-hydroxyisobutyrate dehydrogenase-like beta-hydroxyacid dehydrogenase
LHAEAVREVALGERGIVQGGKEGQVFINLSTTSPELAVSVADALRERGIEMLDAPVSGAAVGAQSGHLTVFVGGNYEAYERSLPVLQQVGQTVTYLGESGKGQIGKRINGAMEALSQLAVYEGMLLARKMNLDLKAFSRAAAGGCAQSWRLDELVREFLLKGEQEFRFHLQRSRTANALQLAESVGVTLPGGAAADRVFAENGWEIVVDLRQ